VSEHEEEEYAGNLMSFEDVEYPPPDEDLSEIALCAIKFPGLRKLGQQYMQHQTPVP
jgi:hypothetical protein